MRVLVADIVRDLLGDAIDFIEARGEKGDAARGFRHLAQRTLSAALVASLLVENADGVDRSVRSRLCTLRIVCSRVLRLASSSPSVTMNSTFFSRLGAFIRCVLEASTAS